MARGLYDIHPLESFIQQGYTILTPNFRLARRIKIEWDARCVAAGAKVWEPLSVMPLENWLLAQWEQAFSNASLPHRTPLGRAQILELWRQVIAEQAQRDGNYQLVRAEIVAEVADQARELLLRWQVDTKSPQIRQLFQFERDCSTYLQWQRAFERQLAAKGLCTAADCLAELVQLASPLPETRVVLVEFEQIQPLLRAALDEVSPQWQELARPETRGQQVVHAFSSRRAELQALAVWLAQQSRTVPAQNIGVVLDADGSDRVALEYLLRREFDCVGDNYTSLPVNFSTGTPLLHAPLIRAAFSALSTALQQTSVPELIDLLHCRFLDAGDTHSPGTQQFIRRLFAQGRETLPIVEVCNLMQGAAKPAGEIAPIERLREVARKPALGYKLVPSAWPEHFLAILSVWGWPGSQGLDSVEYQQARQWNRLLDEFAAFDAVCGPIGFAQALSLLRDSCRRHIFQPQTLDSPIQVLGPLEAAGLSFDQLWVCGMQATTWPAPPRPNPFIPIVVQTRFGMPHANSARELAFSTALLEQYTRNCGTLHASYCRQLEGVPELPSALLAGFALETLDEPDPIASGWRALFEAAELTDVVDESGPQLDCEAGALLAGGSVLIEDQSQCAFRAFARHRLQVRPLPGFHTALSAGDRGSLLHAALAALWQRLGDSDKLASLGTDSEQEVVNHAIACAIASLPASKLQAQGDAFWNLERQRLAAVLHEWLAVERLRRPFTVVATEQEFTLALGPFQLQLRVDRIDQLPDGAHMVIDYKSGQSSVRDWMGERPPRPQLPLYAQAQPDVVAALAFAQVSPRQCRYTGLGRVEAAAGVNTDIPLPVKSDSLEQDWAALNTHWRQVLGRLAQEFIAGNAQVDPYQPSLCTNCGLQPLCRVDSAVADIEVEAE